MKLIHILIILILLTVPIKMKKLLKFQAPVSGSMTSEGRGARVNRVIGSSSIRMWDPFLLLDDFEVPSSAGFPDHPHRGIQTLTYMRKGEITHRDSMGNKGTLTPGGAQLMTAGSGLIHSEFPGKETAYGMQLWINIPKKQKMIDPSYQDFESNELPQIDLGSGSYARVILGASQDQKSPIHSFCTPLKYIHYYLTPNSSVTDHVDAKHQGFIYMRDGSALTVKGEGSPINLKKHHCTTFVQTKEASEFTIVNEGNVAAEFYLVSGIPLDEPVSHGGPFVMNTREEIETAYREFYAGTFIKKKAKFVHDDL